MNIADSVRISIELAKRDVIKLLNKVPASHLFNVFQVADVESCFKSNEVMQTGVNFNLGSLDLIDDLTKDSIPDMDTLVRQLNILDVRLPYPRMSICASINYGQIVDEKIRLAKKEGIDGNEEDLKNCLNPEGASDIHFCFLIESITPDLAFGCVWYTKNPDKILSWGSYPYCSLISFYNPFKDRTFPSFEVLELKGLTFLDSYRDQITTADSCIINLPINSKATLKANCKLDDEDFENLMNNAPEGSLVQMELFRLLFLLNTKGVTTEDVSVTEKKTKRQSKLPKPDYTYKVLKVDAITLGKEYPASEAAGGWSNRVHTCRGHIKIYTIDRPLFGHTTGPVWIRPHIRGKGPGLIIKDYQIKE